MRYISCMQKHADAELRTVRLTHRNVSLSAVQHVQTGLLRVRAALPLPAHLVGGAAAVARPGGSQAGRAAQDAHAQVSI